MRIVWCFLIFCWAAVSTPIQAFLAGKIALLGGLSGNLGDQGGENRFAKNNNNNGYGYGYGYGRQYYSGGGGYTGGNYAGGNYAGGNYAGASYQRGEGEVVKIIKVIIPNVQQGQPTYGGQYTSGWTPVPVPAPIGNQQPLPQPIVQPLPQPIVQPLPQATVQPIPQPQPQPQQFVKTIKLIFDRGDVNRDGFAPSSSLQDNYYSGSSAGLIYKQGGVYEKVGC